jgi:hypothetical protein
MLRMLLPSRHHSAAVYYENAEGQEILLRSEKYYSVKQAASVVG